MQVLRRCRKAGLVKLGHVALDGTKIQANASKHKAMSYGRMARAEAALAAAVAGWLERAEREDAADDAEHGPEWRGDELPEWVKDKQARLEHIRAAKAALEAEAPPEDAEPGPSSGMSDHGRPRRLPGRVGERGPNPAPTGQSDGGPRRRRSATPPIPTAGS